MAISKRSFANFAKFYSILCNGRSSILGFSFIFTQRAVHFRIMTHIVRMGNMCEQLHIYNKWNHNNFKSNVTLPLAENEKITLGILCKASKLRRKECQQQQMWPMENVLWSAENKLGLNLIVHTKNFAPLTRAENSKSQSNLCVFFLLSSNYLCIVCA